MLKQTTKRTTKSQPMFCRKYHFTRVIITLQMLLLLLVSSVAQASSPRHDEPEWYGIVEQMPASGTFTGTWVVGGRTFTADYSTRFEQEHGPLQIGACAEVKYQVTGNGYRATKIESKQPYKCGGSGGGSSYGKVYGVVEQMPANTFIGVWVISGQTYQTDANTYFKQEHGALTVGACVEVYYTQGNPPQVTKIETKRPYKCSSNGSSYTYGNLYGLIEQMPTNGLIGTWTIGGMAFEVGPTTYLEQKHGPFAVGVLVEVYFYTDANSVNWATKIESKYQHHGYRDREGHAYGLIEAMPDGLVGGWRIGGIDYIATQTTRFQQKHGNFQVGNPVKVQYYLDANGSRVMKKLETKPANTIAYPRYKLYGVVEQMPSNSFNGNWVIGGMVFTADTQTRFMEQRGLLAIGAYVEVEYVQNNGINWATQIETHVPPRAGANTYLGRIERMDSDPVTAAEATVSATTWRIGGREYQVTLATDVNDYQIDLGLGTMVLVNSYTDASGIEVVTWMEGVELNHTTFLPMTTR